MKQKWKPTQYIEISIDEIFAFQDKLDAVKDNPEKVWEVVDSFFMEAENQLELSPGFLKELQEIDLKEDFVPLTLNDIDDLFDDEEFENNYTTAKDYVNYVLFVENLPPQFEQFTITKGEIDELKKKHDIPFTPRLNF